MTEDQVSEFCVFLGKEEKKEPGKSWHTCLQVLENCFCGLMTEGRLTGEGS